MGSIYTTPASERWRVAASARCGGRSALEAALCNARARTLALFASYEAALGPGLRVPRSHEVNLPLWELGHIAWFTDWWIARNPERSLGTEANPLATRRPERLAQADSLYDSSNVAHATRWSLKLPDAGTVRAALQASLDDTLTLLADTPENDATLYFFRLALFHEDMHTEAAVYMAQTLGLDPLAHGAERFAAPSTHTEKPLRLPATAWEMGHSAPGFAFDNELGGHTVDLAEVDIDNAPLSWARYLPFVESGAADQRPFWSEAGWAWRQAQPSALPRHLRQGPRGWETMRWGSWQPLDRLESARHVSAFEADAWCRWAGRRLPSEAEWEAAAHLLPDFEWGSVWEWTASAFAPFPGFQVHPYRDYSTPWFDGRPVLKGASPATVPRMRHPRYRNFFPAGRNDIFAGFRSAAL